MNRTLDINTKVTLWEFCERFIKHNTTIYLYSERVYKDEEGILQTELTPLECVMDWQIAANKDDDAYFDAHPDVHKSKYIYNNVSAVINSYEEPIKDRLDCVSLIVEV